MKKIYVNGVHEYDYKLAIDDGNKLIINAGNEIHQLYHSQNHEWSDDVKGKLAISISDNGAGIEFSEPIEQIDYSDAQELRILLGIILKDDCEELQIRIDI
jgi:hypothetical protein